MSGGIHCSPFILTKPERRPASTLSKRIPCEREVRVVEVAVCCEPLSAADFPFKRENNGNFADIGSLLASPALKADGIAWVGRWCDHRLHAYFFVRGNHPIGSRSQSKSVKAEIVKRPGFSGGSYL